MWDFSERQSRLEVCAQRMPLAACLWMVLLAGVAPALAQLGGSQSSGGSTSSASQPPTVPQAPA
ncbi:MAG: hypothetical protein WBQ79_17160, partial [Acidobacteriaceae bacterium]